MATTAFWSRFAQEREEQSDAAREQYVASRLKREQMKRVFDDIAARRRSKRDDDCRLLRMTVFWRGDDGQTHRRKADDSG